MNKISHYESEFELFKAQNKEWGHSSVDSAYHELIAWYDARYCGVGHDEPSHAAVAFGDYVMRKVDACGVGGGMSVRRDVGGFLITDMTEDELRSLLTMIRGAGLQERRTFDNVKRQIEKVLGL